MIRHLSKEHEVVVGSLANTKEELNEALGLTEHCQEVIVEIVPESVRWAHATATLFCRKPSSVAYFWSQRLRHRIEEASSRVGFDATIVHCAFAAQYALEIPAKFRLLDFGDLDSGKWFDYGKWRSFPLSYGYTIEARKLRAYERKVAQSFDYCSVTTQGELEEFEKLLITCPRSVIPNGVNADYFRLNGRGDKEKPIIAFVGRMDYFPNIDAILYFTNEILPMVRRSVPNAELRIVGSNPTRAICKLRELPGVSVTGYVSDVRPYLNEAAVSIAPLRIARGTQNKILESMAMGVPVVATSQAAKGIQAIPGKHFLVADQAKDFAGHVVSLLKNGELRQKFSDAGRLQVEVAHTWSVSMKIIDGILKTSTDVNR